MVNIFHNGAYCSLCACESAVLGAFEAQMIHTVKQGVSTSMQRRSSASLGKVPSEAFTISFLMSKQDLELFIDPKL